RAQDVETRGGTRLEPGPGKRELLLRQVHALLGNVDALFLQQRSIERLDHLERELLARPVKGESRLVRRGGLDRVLVSKPATGVERLREGHLHHVLPREGRLERLLVGPEDARRNPDERKLLRGRVLKRQIERR